MEWVARGGTLPSTAPSTSALPVPGTLPRVREQSAGDAPTTAKPEERKSTHLFFSFLPAVLRTGPERRHPQIESIKLWGTNGQSTGSQLLNVANFLASVKIIFLALLRRAFLTPKIVPGFKKLPIIL